MITIPFTRYISGGIAPLTYIVRPKVQDNSCNCITGTNLTGTVPNNGLITFELKFNGSTCLTEAVANCPYEIAITDSKNCIQIVDIEYEDICQEIEIQVTGNDDFYTAYVTGGTPGYTYFWSYSEGNETAYSSDPASPNFKIPFIPGSTYSQQGYLTVTVTDSNGCQKNFFQHLSFCVPTPLFNNIYFTIPCYNNNTFNYVNEICALGCPNAEIDWSTLTITYIIGPETPFGPGKYLAFTKDPFNQTWTITNNGIMFTTGSGAQDPPKSCYSFWFKTIPDELIPGEYFIRWNVKDVKGRELSSNVTEAYNVLDCTPFNGDGGGGFNINPCGCKASCQTINEQGEIRIPVTQCVISNCGCVPPGGDYAESHSDCIDESTIQIVAGPYLAGATAYFDPYKDELVYVPPIGYEGGDKVLFTGNFISGQSFGLVTWDIDLNCWEDPTSQPDTACAVCCEPVEIDVLANDNYGSPLGWDLSSLQIFNQPSLGTAAVKTNGKIEYTAFCNVSGVDNFSYIVKDAGTGKYINPTEVYVDVTCAGSEQEAFFCVQPEALEAHVETTLQTSGTYKVSFKAYFSNSTQLENGDELEVEFYDDTNSSLIASATLVVGSDLHTPKAGTDNNWTTLINPYLTNATITGGALQSTNGVVSYFNKRGFALANGFANEFDDNGDFVGGDLAIDIAINLTAIDISTPMSSAQVTDYMYRVKVNILEDTNYKDQGANPDGNAATAWDWLAPAGTDSLFNTAASDLHPLQEAKTWFSEYNNPYNVPPGRVMFYSLTSNPGVDVSSGITVDYTSQANLQSQLTGLMQGLGYNFYFNAVNYNSLNVDFALIGNNAGIYIAYQEEADPSLESITLKYNNPAKPTNYLKQAKGVLKNFIIY